MLDDVKDLETYFSRFGATLGARATQALDPLHRPATDPVHPGITGLTRELLPAQAHLTTALVKGWQRQKALFLVGSCGTGKTCVAAATVHLSAGGRPYRALVMCPDHLIAKWMDEIKETLGTGVATVRFKSWREVLWLAQNCGQVAVPQWYVLGRDQSKFEPTRRAAAMKWGALARCPRCGTIVTDKDGNPILPADLPDKGTCKGVMLRWRTDEHGVCHEEETPCGEPLWQFTRKPWRWPPDRIIHKLMPFHFDYLVADEAHELKGSSSVAQANALGKLAASSKKTIAMTGTLIGGYAEHLFPVLMRLAPGGLVTAGLEWGGNTEFNARYGRIETTTYRTEKEGRTEYNKHSRGSTSTRTTKRVRPGVMPQLYGDHLLGITAFLTLDEVSAHLPSLTETIIPVQMDPEQETAYRELEGWFRDVIKPMLVKGDRRMLGRYLQTLLAYPDWPTGWPRISVGDDEFTPADLGDRILPKEEALVQLCLAERDLGRQVWVYIQMTQVRDWGERLLGVLRDAGLKVTLRGDYMQSSVDRQKRGQWIAKRGKTVDVVISHPKLVETGVDLFSKDGAYNYVTLVFAQTGYSTFTVRQAARRSFRLAQTQPCKTAYLYYKGSMQEQAMVLIGKKTAASEAIEGQFSAEGLAALAGDDDGTMALARALVDRVEIPAERVWCRDLGFTPPEIEVPRLRLAPETVPVPTHDGHPLFTDEEWVLVQQMYGTLGS